MTTTRLAALFIALLLAAAVVFAQGLDTTATRDDWEEINFEFNSSVLVDGFPSLLRLAELLQNNAGYRVRIEGHTDGIGSDAYNQRLGQARANTVRDFLVKYGARASQIDAISRGKAAPKVPGQKPAYSRTDEARYMNRRVVLTVMDPQGRTVGAGGAGDAIRAITPTPPQGVQDCCSEVLKRLDRLDEIAKMLRDLADQNAALRKELADLRQGQQALEARVNQPPPPPPPAAPRAPSADEVASAVAQQIEKNKDPRFQLLGVNVGSDDRGNVTFTGKGRFFAPFGTRFAFQTEGEYLYFKGQREGQFDIGLVDRLGTRVQAGLFSSFKHVTLAGNQSGGTLGQAALTVDYIFKYGRLGIFGTKGFLDDALINRANAVNNGVLLRNVILERYLSIVDQAGVSGTIGLWKNTFLEGNAGYLKSLGYGDRFGGTLRFVFPINTKIAFTAEGGVNETLLSRDNSGRAVFGVQFGNFMRPKEYLGANRAIPAQVPRVRYEVLTRTLRVGNDPPVADAGPDLANVAPGTVQLDGSNSYDPDGDPITFQWFQEAGPPVTLSSATIARPTFAAALGQLYAFRLVVKDSYGAQAAARVRISTRAADRAQILVFIAEPREIQQGQTSTLTWRTANADTVNISGIGNVSPNGSRDVTPAQTTTYILTARNSVNEETASATVVVSAPPPVRVLFCTAQPPTVAAGGPVTLSWSAPGAASVTIDQGVGTVTATGSVTVTPAQTTTYTITATGPNNSSTDSCRVTVTVGAVPTGGPPRIVRFDAAPQTINSGQSSNLTWIVENADKVNISQVGDVALNGARQVTPAQTTTYTLTATNAAGSSTATAVVNVNVIAPPKVVSFTADPPTSPSPGSKVSLTCDTTGATSLTINGIQFLPPKATAVVFPNQDTTYSCVATGANGQTDTQSVTVKVTQTPTPGSTPPTIVIAGGNFIQTIYRDIIIDASGSSSPAGNTPLTYKWTSRQESAAILTPTSPAPRVQLFGGLGLYLFDLTVTDSKGNTATATVTILFAGVR